MTQVIILAAGRGKRMGGENSKVLKTVGGEPIIKRLLRSIKPVCETPTIIVGHDAETVKNAVLNDAQFIYQPEQLGTGRAVAAAKTELEPRKDISTIIVVPGDHPFLTTGTLWELQAVHEAQGNKITITTIVVPTYEDDYKPLERYGRVIRNPDGSVKKIVEYKDATDDERNGKEVNVGYYAFEPSWLWENIDNPGER